MARQGLSLVVQPQQGAPRTVELDLSKVRTDPQYLFDDLGFAPYEPPIPAVFGKIVKDSPAEQAGLKAGDRVLKLDGQPIGSFQQLQRETSSRPGQLIQLQVQRGDQTLNLGVIPTHRTDSSGHSYIGIGAERVPDSDKRMAESDKLWQDLRTQQRYGPVAALPKALQQTWDTTVMVVEFVYHMVLGDISIKNISGPINTAQVAGVSASIGLWAFLRFVAVVSLNLGIVNLLPVPLLDGGQILYGLVELVKGSPLSERAQAFGQQVGLTLLVMLMGLAFYNDLARFIG
jgi:regulator of sigma E protease